MFTDPNLHFPYAKQHRTALIRAAERERTAADATCQLGPKAPVMTPVRTSIGGAFIHLGQFIQGVATGSAQARHMA